MTAAKLRKPRPPLDAETLGAIALRYVERFATTRSKLAFYLRRKVRERGWQGSSAADIDGIVQRFADSGYVDDRAYALARSRSLTARGYGAARLRQSLRVAGVEDSDSEEARSMADAEAVSAALHFARRRRIGPFAMTAPGPKDTQKALAAMVRAGHGFGLARAILDLPVGQEIDAAGLMEKWPSTLVESV